MICIYKIENSVTGKIYIGQTVDYEKRKSSHINALRANRHDNTYLQNSWNKYGEKSFEFSVVTECDVEQLDDLEILYIRQLGTVAPNGYNMTHGGDGVRGLKWSPESRAMRSLAMKGKCVGSDAPFYGKTFTPETLEKMRAATTNLWKNEEYRQRQIVAHTGLKQSDETKRKRSVSLMGNTNNKRSHRYRCVETGVEYDYLGQIDLGFEFCRTAIYRACVRGIKAYGYHWEFADVL